MNFCIYLFIYFIFFYIRSELGRSIVNIMKYIKIVLKINVADNFIRGVTKITDAILCVYRGVR